MTLTRVAFIPLPPGKQPGFDHADLYRAQPSTARLYVAHTGADRIEVIDCVSTSICTPFHKCPASPVLGSVALPGEPDVVMHDAALARLYVAIGSPGVVSVIDDHRLETVQTVSTESGAHTIGWNPDTRTLYAFLPRSSGAAVFVEQ
jgi:DNA-binding beta-propeller fold protein YncE